MSKKFALKLLFIFSFVLLGFKLLFTPVSADNPETVTWDPDPLPATQVGEDLFFAVTISSVLQNTRYYVVTSGEVLSEHTTVSGETVLLFSSVKFSPPAPGTYTIVVSKTVEGSDPVLSQRNAVFSPPGPSAYFSLSPAGGQPPIYLDSQNRKRFDLSLNYNTDDEAVDSMRACLHFEKTKINLGQTTANIAYGNGFVFDGMNDSTDGWACAKRTTPLSAGATGTAMTLKFIVANPDSAVNIFIDFTNPCADNSNKPCTRALRAGQLVSLTNAVDYNYDLTAPPITPTLTVPPTPTPTPPSWCLKGSRGDLNCNGTINQQDVDDLLTNGNYLTGTIPFPVPTPPPTPHWIYDLTGDNQADEGDLNIILRNWD